MNLNTATGEAEVTVGEITYHFRFSLRAGMRLDDLLAAAESAYPLTNAIVVAARLQAGYLTANPGAEFSLENAIDLMDVLVPDDLVELDAFATDCLRFFYLAPMTNVGAYWKEVHEQNAGTGNSSSEPR